MEVNDDQQQDRIPKSENGSNKSAGNLNQNNSNHKTFSIDDILRPKALKLQPSYAPQGLTHHDKNFNFSFDPSSRQPVAKQQRGLLGQGFSSVIRGHSSKDSSVGVLHQRGTFLTPQGENLKDFNDRNDNGKESCPSCVVSPGQTQGSAVDRGGDAACFSGRDVRCSEESSGDGPSTATFSALRSPSQQEAHDSPSPHDGSCDVPRGDPGSPSAATPAQTAALADREYHGMPSVPHPTYPAPPPLHQQSLPTVCLPLPPVSVAFFFIFLI